MSEHMSPIPSRIYNAAVGGHVCGPEDVDFGQKVVHLIKYDRNGNEVSFESQVTQANKIYVIHDDFVLSSNVTIPANCVLEFEGGSLSGAYTITGRNTKIDYDGTIFTGVKIQGSWDIPLIKSSMFSDIHSNNILKELFNLQNKDMYNVIEIEESDNAYNVSVDNNLKKVLVLYSNTKLILNGTVKLQQNSFYGYRILTLYGNNITVEGKGSIIGDKDLHDYSTYQNTGFETHEWGHGLVIQGGKRDGWPDDDLVQPINPFNNINVSGISIHKTTGDSLNVGDGIFDVNIYNIVLTDSRRNGLTIGVAHNIIFSNFIINNINGTNPQSGIDIEPNESAGDAYNIYISNGIIGGTTIEGVSTDKHNNTIKNIFVSQVEMPSVYLVGDDNIELNNSTIKYFSTTGCKSCEINNCKFENIDIRGSRYEADLKFIYCSLNRDTNKDGLLVSTEGNDINVLFSHCKLDNDGAEFRFSGDNNNHKNNISFENCSIMNATEIPAAKYINCIIESEANIAFSSRAGITTPLTILNSVINGNRLFIDYIQKDIKIQNCTIENSNPGELFVTYSSGFSTPKPKCLFLNNKKVGAVGGELHDFSNRLNNLMSIVLDDTLNNGSSSERPILDSNSVGYQFYDSTLGKPIYWNGTDWVDATGATV